MTAVEPREFSSVPTETLATLCNIVSDHLLWMEQQKEADSFPTYIVDALMVKYQAVLASLMDEFKGRHRGFSNAG